MAEGRGTELTALRLERQLELRERPWLPRSHNPQHRRCYMNRYTIVFCGRLMGALGIYGRYTETVEAETAHEALLKLYERYEHISIHSSAPVTNGDRNTGGAK